MLELFKEDAARWVIPQQIADPATLTFLQILKLLYHHMPLRMMFWYRLGSWLTHKHVPSAKGFFQRMLFRAGLEIEPGADIGGGLYIAHPIGSVIFPKRIGKNCTIIHSVTFGMRNEWAFPEIGDNVFIGAGARVLGGIHLGDNATIGANAVVLHDVPAGATAVGIPAKIIKNKETLNVNA